MSSGRAGAAVGYIVRIGVDRWLGLVVSVIVAAHLGPGCAAAQKKAPVELLRDAAIAWCDGLRWQQYALSASVLPLEEREPFLASKEEERDRVFVLDYEIRRIELVPDASQAFVEVQTTWHRLPSTTIRNTITHQRWEREGELWLLVEQAEASGASKK